jgi:hypothetical protein
METGIQRCMYPNVEQQFGQAHTMNSSGQVRREIALTLCGSENPGVDVKRT